MSKFFAVFLVLLSFSNLSFAKNIQLGSEIILDVPDSHEFILIDEDGSTESLLYGAGELFENLEELDIKFSVVGPAKLIEVIQSLVDGTDVQDIDIFEPLIKAAEKREYYDFEDPKTVKWFGKEVKKIMKKEKIDFYTYVIFSNKKINKIEDATFREFIDLHRNRSNSELAKITKEYKKYLTQWAGDNKTFFLNEYISLTLNKFKISNVNNQPLFRSDVKMSYLHAFSIPMNLVVSIKNGHLFLILSECWVNCSKLTKRFEKMIAPIFSNTDQKISTGTENATNDIADEIMKLNELYESGVLTKEEFEKAKKKILN